MTQVSKDSDLCDLLIVIVERFAIFSVEERGDADNFFLFVDNREGQDILDLPSGLIHCLFLSGERQRTFAGSFRCTPAPSSAGKFNFQAVPKKGAKSPHLKCKVLVGPSVHHVADLEVKKVSWLELLINSRVLIRTFKTVTTVELTNPFSAT